MDLRSICDRVPTLIMQRNFKDAEATLLDARREALAANDLKALGEYILPLLVNVYSAQEPPNLLKAESYSYEREQVDPRAYNKLQTAMLLYHVAGDYVRALPKVEAAINEAVSFRNVGTPS